MGCTIPHWQFLSLWMMKQLNKLTSWLQSQWRTQWTFSLPQIHRRIYVATYLLDHTGASNHGKGTPDPDHGRWRSLEWPPGTGLWRTASRRCQASIDTSRTFRISIRLVRSQAQFLNANCYLKQLLPGLAWRSIQSEGPAPPTKGSSSSKPNLPKKIPWA